MMHEFTTIAAHRGGYILRPDLLDLGYRDRHIRQALKAGLLVRLRAGTYAPQEHAALRPEDRYRLLCFAVQDKLPSRVVLSHQSASVVHTGVTWGQDMTKVHVTRLDGRSHRPEAGVVHHAGTLPDTDIIEVNGRLVVVPARAALETASVTGVEAGMIQTSLAMRDGVDARELHERLELMRRWPGFNSVRMQVELHNAGGVWVARLDFDWEDFFHCGEFDGLAKYGRLNPYTTSMPGQVLVDEKLREDAVPELRRGMSRWIWRDLDTPRATCDRIRTGMERSRRLFGPPHRTIVA